MDQLTWFCTKLDQVTWICKIMDQVTWSSQFAQGQITWFLEFEGQVTWIRKIVDQVTWETKFEDQITSTTILQKRTRLPGRGQLGGRRWPFDDRGLGSRRAAPAPASGHQRLRWRHPHKSRSVRSAPSCTGRSLETQ